MGPLDPSNPNFPVYIALMEGRTVPRGTTNSRVDFGLIVAMLVTAFAFGIVLACIIL